MAAARIHRSAFAAKRLGRDHAEAFGGAGPAVDAAAPRWSSMAWWSALSLLPDADVIGFPLGVRYGDPWGHRGATHSLVFAIALAAGVGLLAPAFRRPRLRTWVIATVVLASHGLLDTMTDGGLGCALLWPFDLTRYFAPWRPIPVAPIGLDFFSFNGFLVAAIELILFAPIVMFAVPRWRLSRKIFIPIWSVLVWLCVSGDPVRQKALGVILREDTEYASGFSDATFNTIEPGHTDAEVERLLGPPLGEWWSYPRVAPWEASAADCQIVYFESGLVATEPGFRPCMPRGIQVGMSRNDVHRALGAPGFLCWGYSRSRGHGSFRQREVCFADGKVAAVFHRWVSR
jgi:inner membrane protein